MKKVIVLLLCLSASFMGYAQCNSGCIIGNLTIPLGQTTTFTSPVAQCTSCYDWDINNNATSSDNQTVGTVKIVGTDMSRTVQIQGLTVGAFSLQLTYFDETGCHTCCLNGNVISCNITQNGVYEVNQLGDENVKFYTTPSILSGGVNNFNYMWTFTYKNGTTSTSNLREPYIPINCSNPVIRTSVLITSAICSKTITQKWILGVCGTLGHPSTSSASSNTNPTSLKMSVFPNPVSNDLTVVFDKQVSDTEGGASQLELYNLQGQLLKQQPLEAGLDETKVSMQQLPAGVYMISLRQNGQIATSVQVIKH